MQVASEPDIIPMAAWSFGRPRDEWKAVMDLPPTFFDPPRWLASRITAAGGPVACDEAMILHGRAMLRAFLTFCLRPVAGDGDDDGDLDRALADNPLHDREAREVFARLLRAPALFWLWARHPTYRPMIRSRLSDLRDHEAVWRKNLPKRDTLAEWSVSGQPPRTALYDRFDAAADEMAPVANAFLRFAMGWCLTPEGKAALKVDGDAFLAGATPASGSDSPLWPLAARPEGWDGIWAEAKEILGRAEAPWPKWVGWIDARLDGAVMREPPDVDLFWSG